MKKKVLIIDHNLCVQCLACVNHAESNKKLKEKIYQNSETWKIEISPDLDLSDGETLKACEELTSICPIGAISIQETDEEGKSN